MNNNPTLPPTKLVLRTFTTDLPADAVKRQLQELVETSALFNTSFLNGEWDEDTRIGGMDQHGDIIIRHRTERAKRELTIEHRAGDEPQVVEIITALGKSITRRATLPVPGLNRPKGMAYFFEMIQGNPLKSKVLVTDAVVESAHDLRFEDYREVRKALDFLAKLRTIKRTYDEQDRHTQTQYHLANIKHPDPKVCLFEGKKLFLRNQIVVKPDLDGPHLMMHFTRLPKGRFWSGSWRRRRSDAARPRQRGHVGMGGKEIVQRCKSERCSCAKVQK